MSIVEKHLKDGLLEPNTFKVPLSARVKCIWDEVGWLLPILGLILVILVLFMPAASTQGSLWVLIAFGGLLVACLIWAVVWFGILNVKPFYTINGVNVVFEHPDYYVDPEVMQAFLGDILVQWEMSGALTTIPAEVLLKGLTLYLTPERPVDPLKRIAPEKMVGISYFGKQYSEVYGPYVLSHSGAGYELRLQMARKIHPKWDEPKLLDWMVEHDLV